MTRSEMGQPSSKGGSQNVSQGVGQGPVSPEQQEIIRQQMLQAQQAQRQKQMQQAQQSGIPPMTQQSMGSSQQNQMQQGMSQMQQQQGMSQMQNMQQQQNVHRPQQSGAPSPQQGRVPRPPQRGGQQPTNMQQGRGYNPQGSSGGNQIPDFPTRGNGQQNGNQPPNKTFMFIGIGVVALLIILVAAYFLMNKGSKETDESETFVEETLDWGFEETIVWEFETETVPVFEYTSEEIKELRAAGYTGNEIEFYMTQERPAQELLEEAEQEQSEYVERFIAPYYDDTSDEYRRNLRNTWLGLEERRDVSDFSTISFTYSETKNLDFEKVPIYGDQIFLKVYLDDVTHDKYFFMSCMPDRYLQLGDSGNIVVQYNYIYPTYIDSEGITQEDTSRMFITSASEVIVAD